MTALPSSENGGIKAEQEEGRTRVSREEFTIEQYKQAYEDFRQLWITFWQIPTVAVSIAAGIFAVVFISLWGTDRWLESGTILLVGHILTFVLAFVAHKHRFFGAVWAGTLSKIEEEEPYFKKYVRRTAYPEKEVQHAKEPWFDMTPRWHQSPSGENMLMWGLVVISSILLVFSMYAFHKDGSLAIALPLWLIGWLAWLRLSGLRRMNPFKWKGWYRKVGIVLGIAD